MVGKIVYFDHSATTAPRKRVVDAMASCFKEDFGNPSSLHKVGVRAKESIRRARERVANALGASRDEEIFFTSGGTESDNWAIKGAARANRDKGNHIITSAIEHKAILESCHQLELEGFEVTYLPVDAKGVVSYRALIEAIKDQTTLISIMTANNEVGTLQPISEIGSIARERGILFHTDAVQAVGSIPVNVKAMNVDMLSISGHKFYGPKGIGALYVREGTEIEPIIRGGGQEDGMRAGTENVPGIVGMATAIELAVKEQEAYAEKLLSLRSQMTIGLKKNIPSVIFNGDQVRRLPGNLNVTFPGADARELLEELSERNIAVSTGSACRGESVIPSHVLIAMGLTPEMANSTLRLTFGRFNTSKDVEYFLKVITELAGVSQYQAENRRIKIK
ncbi:MAG: cysteine desulfurase family protein [Ignavibacteriales bacterium]